MSHARYLIGDVFDRMSELPDGSVDLILTSPPFLALRSYLPADHPDKAKEIGSEPTPAAFIDTLLVLTAEWRRLLAPHGSICVELGDTYAGSGGAGGDYNEGGLRSNQPKFSQTANNSNPDDPNKTKDRSTGRWGQRIDTGGLGWPLAKSLCAIPQLYEASLAYGRNLLTGQPSPAGQWRVRNLVAWCRPNPPVGALGDKFRPATSYLTIACVSDRRYFDLDAVRTEPTTAPQRRFSNEWGKRGGDEKAITYGDNYLSDEPTRFGNPAGVPPLDWWSVPWAPDPPGDDGLAIEYLLEVIDELTSGGDPLDRDSWEIPTHPYPGAHYATFPPALCVKPILAMCPSRVCVVCGEPSTRIVGEPKYVSTKTGATPATLHFRDADRGDVVVGHGVRTPQHQSGHGDGSVIRNAPTLGWSDCDHNQWRNGLVLDPFAGSGTTLAVATGHGRDAIGIDLDRRNAQLAAQRVGMFLEVETSPAGGV